MTTKQKKRNYWLKQYETKGDISNSGVATVTDLVAGALAGGAASAVLGKHSLIPGAVISLAGHYWGVPIVSSFGLGIMASTGHKFGTVEAPASVNGFDFDQEQEAAKKRLGQWMDNVREKFYLDSSESVNGLHGVSYYLHGEGVEDAEELAAWQELDRIEAELEQSAQAYGQADEAPTAIAGMAGNGLEMDYDLDEETEINF